MLGSTMTPGTSNQSDTGRNRWGRSNGGSAVRRDLPARAGATYHTATSEYASSAKRKLVARASATGMGLEQLPRRQEDVRHEEAGHDRAGREEHVEAERGAV